MTEMLKRDFLREKLCILDGITCVDDTKFNFEIRSLGIDDHYHAIKINNVVSIFYSNSTKKFLILLFCI